MSTSIQFQFVNAGSVDPSSKESSKVRAKTVRAHAARNSTARVQRVLDYQRSQEHKAEQRVAARRRALGIRGASEGEHGQQILKPLRREPSPLSWLSPSRIDPFDSFVWRIGPTESLLLDSYMNDLMRHGVNTYVSVTHADKSDLYGLLRQYWLQSAATDAGIMCALLSAACRHLNFSTGSERWLQHSIYYQAKTVESLRVSLAAEGRNPSDASITKAMALATEAIITANPTQAKRHVFAALQMFHMRGTTDESVELHTECFDAWDGLDRAKVDDFFSSSSPSVDLVPMPRMAKDADPCHVYTKFLMTQMKNLHLRDWNEV